MTQQSIDKIIFSRRGTLIAATGSSRTMGKVRIRSFKYVLLLFPVLAIATLLFDVSVYSSGRIPTTTTGDPPIDLQIQVSIRSHEAEERRDGSSPMLLPSRIAKNNDDRPQQRRRPTVLLHIGISKTGTTFLQCTLSSNEIRSLMLADNYVYLGTCPQDCGRREAQENNNNELLSHTPSSFFAGNTKWKHLSGENYDFRTKQVGSFVLLADDGNRSTSDRTARQTVAPGLVQKLDKLRGQGRNAIIVFEGFERCSPSHIRAFAETLHRDWDVMVIINYRRIFEWLPSLHNQIHKPSPGQLRSWRKIVPPFDLPSNSNHRGTDAMALLVESMERHGVHPAEVVRRRFAEHFRNITMINIHDLQRFSNSRTGDPYLVNLFCHVLPSLSTTCRGVRLGQVNLLASSYNPSYPTNYDNLATEAYRKNLFESSLNGNAKKGVIARLHAIEAIRHRQEDILKKTEYDFPVKCLPAGTLERLWNLSLVLERNTFPSDTSKEAEHRAAFDKAVEGKKFCHIAVDEVLQDQEWRKFFASL